MRLLEVFDATYALSEPEVDIADNGFGSITYHFVTEEHRPYSVTFSTVSEDAMMVEFAQDGSMSMAGSGDEFRVFATVIEACRNIIRMMPRLKELGVVVLAAKGQALFEKRRSLYMSIIRHEAPDWTIESQGNESTLHLTIKIPDTK